MLAVQNPVYPADMPIADLQTPEMFLVAVLRLWAAPYRNREQSHPHWRQGFVTAGLDDDGTAAFDSLLRIVAAASRQPLDVRCVRCVHLGEDEARFLELIGWVQRGRPGDAAMILLHWMPATAARAALPQAVLLASAMTSHGLAVPHRVPARPPDRTPAAARHSADRGLALVH
jgi:hypothetical protein